MNEVSFVPNDKAAFTIEENGNRVAEMIVGITDKKMSVYHTEVASELEGKGFGTRLVEGMADYARKNKLKVDPICPFVKAKFQDFPDKYDDIWVKSV